MTTTLCSWLFKKWGLVRYGDLESPSMMERAADVCFGEKTRKMMSIAPGIVSISSACVLGTLAFVMGVLMWLVYFLAALFDLAWLFVTKGIPWLLLPRKEKRKWT